MKKFSNFINEEYEDSKFKLGLDYHGVINNIPHIFSFITESIIKNGGEIHILTGSSWTNDIEKYLKDNKIQYTHKFSIYDYLVETGAKITGEKKLEDGTFQKEFENESWDRAKGDYCLKHNINLHIDDTMKYNEYFKTPFARLWTHSGTPKSTYKDARLRM